MGFNLGTALVHDAWPYASASISILNSVLAMSIVVLRLFRLQGGSEGRVEIAFCTVAATSGRRTNQDALPKWPVLPILVFTEVLVRLNKIERLNSSNPKDKVIIRITCL